MAGTNSAILEQLVKQNALLAEKFSEQNALLKTLAEENKKIRWEAWTTRREVEILRRTVSSPLIDDVEEFAQQRQLSFIKTIETLRDEKLSFARFGDGELQIMLREDYKLGFQSNSPELRAALRGVLSDAADSDSVLIGFPHIHRNVQWSTVWADTWAQARPLFEPIPRFGNTHISRPAFFQAMGTEGVKAWRSLWQGRDVHVVRGRGSRFELIPDLFSSAGSVEFVDSQPKDAFSDVGRIIDIVMRKKSDLILTALGPAGTVLASELSKRGKQAIDIGHISASYQNVFEGGAWPEAKSLTK